MAKDKRIRKHKLRRQMTVTRSKAIIGFVASVIFSTFLGTYFEQHGMEVYKETKSAMFGGKEADSDSNNSKTSRDQGRDSSAKNGRSAQNKNSIRQGSDSSAIGDETQEDTREDTELEDLEEYWSKQLRSIQERKDPS